MSKTWDIRGRRGANDDIVTIATVHELEYHGEWMEDEYVTVTVKSPTPIDFQYGDFLQYRSETYVIDYEPSIIKKARSESYGEAFVYENIKLYSQAHEMVNTQFRDFVLNDNLVHTAMSRFSFFADSVEDLADRIQANMNRVYNGTWAVFTPNRDRTYQRIPGQIPRNSWEAIYGDASHSTIKGNRDQNVECQDLTCKGAAALIYNTFNVPFTVNGRTIIIGAPSVSIGNTFRYGKGNGLYEIERTQDDTQIVTKLYAYGSDQNIPLNYYANLHKYPVVRGVRHKFEILDEPIGYGIKTNTLWGKVKNSLTRTDTMCLLSYNGRTIKAFADQQTWDDESQIPYLYMRFYHDATTQDDKAFYDALGEGEVTVRIVSGVDINSWPAELIAHENEETFPSLLAINRLMLPGFPDMSLDAYVRGAAAGEFIMAGISSLQESMRIATSLLAHYSFSTDATAPWIRSHLASVIGVKEGSIYFDGNNDNEEIKPSIKGTDAAVVNIGSDVEDNGFITDDKDHSFYITVANSNVIEWDKAWGQPRTEDVYIEMTSGYCTGRRFKMLEEPEKTNAGWKMKLDRDKDTSQDRYFPYHENSTSGYAQVRQNDTFVVTGLTLPDSYIAAASVRLLIASCEALGKIDHPHYTYTPKIDEIQMQRQDDEAKASGGTIQSIHDTLRPGLAFDMQDTDLAINDDPVIDVITIKENGNNGIPTYDVVLRVDKEKNLLSLVQDSIDKALGGVGDGLTDLQIEAILKQLGAELFLSKVDDDTAKGLITFLKGLKVGNYVSGETGAYISPYGDAELRNLLVRLKAKAKELEIGDYEEGLDGAHIDEHGNTEVEDLWARGKTTLGKDGQEQGYDQINLEVKGSSTFNGNLSSPDFVSGWPSGYGWALQRKEYINPAGEVEYKYVLECDGANIRGTLRVYEFIISQLLGENDNRIFTAMMEVHHYDASTGKVWLSTNGGKLYMPFRKDDCIMVQQYQPGNTGEEGGDGYVTKSYELLITAVGTGGMTDENGDRLDWVTFTNFTTDMAGGTAASLIKQYDTFCRLDNISDPERKGIIQMVAVGTNAPYMDIIYGLKTNPDIEDYLKGRLGNLEGINHHLFGWLQGFGEYLINSYIVGDVRLRRTGQSLDTTLEILNGKLLSQMTQTVNEISGDDNLLSNATFREMNASGSLKDWTISADNVTFYTVGGEVVVSSVGTFADAKSFVKTEDDDGRLVLHIQNANIRQDKRNMKSPGTHKEYIEGTGEEEENGYVTNLNKLYMTVRVKCIAPGTLSIGFPESTMTEDDAIKNKVALLERSDEWKTLKWSGTWDGNSDFVLSFTGELEVSLLSITEDKVSALQTEYSTSIVQTANNITFEATRITANGENIASLDIRADGIEATVESNYTDLDGRVKENKAQITITAEEIRSEVSTIEETLDGKIEENKTSITQNATDISLVAERVTATEDNYAALSIKADKIESDVTTNKEAYDDFIAGDFKDVVDQAQGIYDDLYTESENSYATWRIQTGTQITDLAAEWDPETGKIASYSTITQTASDIQEAVTTAKDYTDTLKGLINTDVLKDEQGNWAYTSWKTQTDNQITSLVAKWDPETGEIANYSTTTQTESLIATKVEAYGYQTASDVNGLIEGSTKWDSYTTTEQLPDQIKQTVTAKYINDKVDFTGYATEDELPDMTLYYDKSAIDQMSDSINLSVARVEQEIVSISDVSMWEDGGIKTSASAGVGYDDIKQAASYSIRYKNLVSVNTATSLLLNTGYTIRFAYFDSNKKLKRIASSVKSPNSYGLVNVDAASNEPYVAIVINHGSGGAMDPANVTSTGISITKDNVVTSAYLSLYIDKSSVSWLTGSADNVIFNFSNKFQIQHNNSAVLEITAAGDLLITGQLKAGSTIGTVEPMRVNPTTGEIERKSPDDTWISNYAGRYVKVLTGRTYGCTGTEDFLVSDSGNEQITLPTGVSNGKIITIKNLGTNIRIYPGTGQKIYSDRVDDYRDLSEYYRAEFVYYKPGSVGYWYWSYSET